MTDERPASPPSAPASTATRSWWRGLLRLFAVLGVLSAIALVWLMAMLLDFGPGRREQPVLAKAGEERRFTVGQIEPLVGTSLIAIEISATGEAGAISKGYGSDRRNLLLLDRSTGRSRRVLPDNNRQIRELHYLPNGGAGSQTLDNDIATVRTHIDRNAKNRLSPVRFYMLEVADPAHPATGHDVLVGAITTGEPSVVLRNIDQIDHLEMLDEDRVSLIVREKGQLHFKVLDLPVRKVTEDHLIDIG